MENVVNCPGDENIATDAAQQEALPPSFDVAPNAVPNDPPTGATASDECAAEVGAPLSVPSSTDQQAPPPHRPATHWGHIEINRLIAHQDTGRISELRLLFQCDDPACPCHKPTGNVHCPAHNHSNLSLKFYSENGKVSCKCLEGCHQATVEAKIQEHWDKAISASAPASATAPSAGTSVITAGASAISPAANLGARNTAGQQPDDHPKGVVPKSAPVARVAPPPAPSPNKPRIDPARLMAHQDNTVAQQPDIEKAREAFRCKDAGCACQSGTLVHCPAHDDQNPSMSLDCKNGKLLWHCHAGCDQAALTAKVNERLGRNRQTPSQQVSQTPGAANGNQPATALPVTSSAAQSLPATAPVASPVTTKVVKSPKERGIEDTTMRAFGIQSISGGWIYPTFHADGSPGRLRIKRSDASKGKYYWREDRNLTVPAGYNLQRVAEALRDWRRGCAVPILPRDLMGHAGSLFTRLHEAKDPISQFLRSQFTPALCAEIDGLGTATANLAPQGRQASALEIGVADELSKLIQRDLLYEETRFAEIQLPPLIQHLLQLHGRNPLDRSELTLLNRFLLQCAYPDAIGVSRSLQYPPIWIVGGEPDVWVMHQNGFTAVSTFGETQGHEALADELQKLGVWKCHIVLDHDAAGRRGAAAMARACQTRGIDCAVYSFEADERGHDVCDEFARLKFDRAKFRERIKNLPIVLHEDLSNWASNPEDGLPAVANAVEPYGFYSLDELRQLPRKPQLIKGWIPQGGMVMLSGKHSTGKSVIALDCGLCVATGTPWHGRDVAGGNVLYIAGEGQDGLRDRADAWRTVHGASDTSRFLVLKEAVQLHEEGARARLLEAFRRCNRPFALIIVDTLSACGADLDDNIAADMKKFLGAMEQISHATGATVMVLHHHNKGGEYRGSTALAAGVDTHLTTSTDDGAATVRLEVLKQRDFGAAAPLALKRRVIALPPLNGEPWDSIVYEPDDDATNAYGRLSLNEQAVLRALIEISVVGPNGHTGATASQWEKVCCGTKNMSKATFDRAKRKLLNEVNAVHCDNPGARGARYIPDAVWCAKLAPGSANVSQSNHTTSAPTAIAAQPGNDVSAPPVSTSLLPTGASNPNLQTEGVSSDLPTESNGVAGPASGVPTSGPALPTQLTTPPDATPDSVS